MNHRSTTCGIDEVGRGCLAGDVYAAAVVFHRSPPDGIRDSKTLSAKRRRELDALIRDCAYVSVGIATVSEIDRINILQATFLAMSRAYLSLPCLTAISDILVDGNRIPRIQTRATIQAVVGGDSKHVEIAAASIVAKVARDEAMSLLHTSHPEYDWLTNKGYGSPRHLSALARIGPCIHHRRTFAPVRNLLEGRVVA